MTLDIETIKELTAYGTGALLVGLSAQAILEVIMMVIAKVISWFRSSV